MHENNPVLNALGIGFVIGLLMVAVWGTTFTAQAITGRSLARQGKGGSALTVPNQNRVVEVPSFVTRLFRQ
jgi:hypothetical protein